MRGLSRRHLLAAELYGYSYDHYADHLGDGPGMGNVRFEKYMPHDVDALERAEREGWDAARLAAELDAEESLLPDIQSAFQEAKDIVDAPSLAQSFRRGVRHSIEHALEKGLKTDEDIERLVTQICYRAADLGYRLKVEGRELSELSEELRFGKVEDLSVLDE